MIDDLISVIVPVYNVESYLEHCIESILKQTYNKIEIILVDDGSTDDSPDICDKFAKEDNRIKIIHKLNEGVSVARNYGLSIASGNWIMFVDADDYLDPNILEVLLSKGDSQSDIIACCCKVFFNSNSSNSYDEYFFESDRIFISDEEKKDLFLQLLYLPYRQLGKAYTAIGVPWGKLYKKSFLIKYQLQFNPSMKRFQDNLFNMYAFYYAREIKYVNSPLYNYRYDHLQNIYSNKLNGIVNNSHMLAKERYIFFSRRGLFGDANIKYYYKVSVLKNIIDSFEYGIFVNEQGKMHYPKKKQVKEVYELEYFELFFNQTKVSDFTKFKYKASFYVLKHKLIFIFYLFVWEDRFKRSLNN